MIINKSKYFPFVLNFKKIFQTSTHTLTERKGFIIWMIDEIGNVSYGECSPLPGLSKETIDETERNLIDVQKKLVGSAIQLELSTLTALLSELNMFPSLQFGIEQALLGLLIQRDENFIRNFFGEPKTVIEVNAIIGLGSTESVLSRIEEKFVNGYRTFKLKVGKDNFEEDFLLINKIREKFGDKIKLRLDANGKWNIDDALENLKRLEQFKIEYIEEPCGHLSCLLKLSAFSPIPLAADESLHTIDDALKIINESKIDFIVLKPIIIGGIISSFHLIKEAEKKNKKVVVSSAFESAVGRSALTFLASFTHHNFAHGLDTAEYIEKDLCTIAFEAKYGKINFNSKDYPPQFNLSLS